ncbi:uncharacterized protein LOC119678980 [Teleopsis dalmanni]|uniref:uncharacterized protein LOC119678980 n=1 Tax=Teleopsis dalmanni TaxID=139649 RepID=UPI0018CCC8E8|nr:uncharacterized protein LOC119678980 [Teleopsis dalmanni]
METENLVYNTDELEAPQWLNADFLTKVLKECEGDSAITIKNYKLTPATVRGDHYASVMFRAEVDYVQTGRSKTKSMIIKTMPEEDGSKKELLQETHIFETEIGIYSEVIPRMEKILRAVGDNTVLGAKYLYYSLSPRKVIVFEDLVTVGYKVLRQRLPTMEEAKMTYLKLAKWHAVSYKLLQENPTYFDKYRYSIMTLTNFVESDFFIKGIDLFIELLSEVPTLRKYKSYFESIQQDLIQDCKDIFTQYTDKKQSNTDYVLCHGDFHCKNMMFKHNPESGELEDLMLLDYQVSYVGSLVNDIIYSYFLILNPEMRLNHFDEMLYYYFKNFTETLTNIGYNGAVPKLEEIRSQIMKHKKFELFLLTTMLPMWYVFFVGEIDPDEMIESEDARKNVYRNKDYIKELHNLLPRYMHLGYFEN